MAEYNPSTNVYPGSGTRPTIVGADNYNKAVNPTGSKSGVIQTTTANRNSTQKNVQSFNDLMAQIAQNNKMVTEKTTKGADTPADNTSTPKVTSPTSTTENKPSFARVSVPSGWASENTQSGGQVLTSPSGGKVYTNPNDNPEFNKATTAATGASPTAPATPAPSTSTGDNNTGTSSDQSQTEDPLASIKSEIESIHSAGEQQVADIQSTLKTTLQYVDTNTANTISTLTGMYTERMASVKDSYARLAAKKSEGNIRNGLDRYAPDQAQGVLTDTEVTGQMKIADLQTKMNDAITKVTDAQSSNDSKAFNAAYKEVDSIQKNMTTEVNNLFKSATAWKNAQTKALHDQQTSTSKALSDNVKSANEVAPYLAKEIATMGKDDQDKFYKAYSTQTGIPEGILRGATEKAGLSRANTLSTMANRGKSSGQKPTTDGTITYTPDDISKIEGAMPAGDDNFVSTDTYNKLYQAWIKKGGTGAGFIKAFPPKTHLNPNDPTVPDIFKQYLKTKKASTSSSPAAPSNLGGN